LIVNAPEPKRNTLAVVLRVGLLVALVGAGWRIYQRLPMGESGAGGPQQARATTLHIILRRAPDTNVQGTDVDVQLFPVDVAAVQREFDSERRPGLRFREFLVRRMQGRAPVAARLDESGQADVALTPGRWWVHATLTGPEEITWRLPVNVAGRAQTIELTPDNAYMRTKSF
jgi:hypothetical protein